MRALRGIKPSHQVPLNYKSSYFMDVPEDLPIIFWNATHNNKMSPKLPDDKLILVNHGHIGKEGQIRHPHGLSCSLCGYNRCMNALVLHHVKPSKDNFSVGKMMYTHAPTEKSKEKNLNEIGKCVLLCSNCRREVLAGDREIIEPQSR